MLARAVRFAAKRRRFFGVSLRVMVGSVDWDGLEDDVSAEDAPETSQNAVKKKTYDRSQELLRMGKRRNALQGLVLKHIEASVPIPDALAAFVETMMDDTVALDMPKRTFERKMGIARQTFRSILSCRTECLDGENCTTTTSDSQCQCP